MKKLKKLFSCKTKKKHILFSTGVLIGLSLTLGLEWMFSGKFPSDKIGVLLCWSAGLTWMVLDYTWRAWKHLDQINW